MEIPDDVVFETVYKKGAVFYFVEEEFSSTEPHFFIILNHSPQAQKVFILAIPSHRVMATYYRRPEATVETLIQVSPTEYEGFTKDSIIDCNRVMVKSITEIKDKHQAGKLRLKPDFPDNLLKKLVNGVKSSPLIEKRLKDLL